MNPASVSMLRASASDLPATSGTLMVPVDTWSVIGVFRAACSPSAGIDGDDVAGLLQRVGLPGVHAGEAGLLEGAAGAVLGQAHDVGHRDGVRAAADDQLDLAALVDLGARRRGRC